MTGTSAVGTVAMALFLVVVGAAMLGLSRIRQRRGSADHA
jgi:hypothetical protein